MKQIKLNDLITYCQTNNIEQINETILAQILNHDIYSVLYKHIALLINNDLIIGGSHVLNKYGLLNREPGDMDLIIKKERDFQFLYEKYGDLSKGSGSSDLLFDNNLVQVISFQINGYSFDCFYLGKDDVDIPYQEISTITSEFGLILLKYQRLDSVIAFKKQYSTMTTNPKHNEDLEYITKLIKKPDDRLIMKQQEEDDLPF